MVLPLPPIVHGPITRFSPSVRVTGVLADATVELFADGGQIGKSVAGSNGTVWVTIFDTPNAGQLITAVQTTTDGSSAPSPQSVPVIDLPNPPPSPVFVSPLTTAMSAVRLSGLVPGASVTISNNGTVVGLGGGSETTAWIPILAGASLDAGTPLVAEQTLAGISSPSVASLPLVQIGREVDLPTPNVAQPVTACETSINVSGVTPSADLIADNEGVVTTWFNPAEAYAAWGAPQFRQGKMLVKQAFPRLNSESGTTTVPVGPPVTPPTPTIQSDICPQIAQIKLSNLAPGSVVTVYTRAPDPANPGTIVETAIGTAGVSASSEPFNLPPGVNPVTSAGQPVLLTAAQSRCGLTSAKAAPAKFAAAGGPYMVPILAGPLYDCARVVVMQSAHPGSQVEARSTATGLPLGDLVFVDQPTVFFKTWFPLVEDDKVFIRQYGCNANGDSAADRVHPLPAPIPVPEIGAPVRPAAPFVYAHGFLRGARAHLLVNGVLRSSVDTQYSDAWIPVGAPPLTEEDVVFVVQTLCAHASAKEGRGVPVTRGHLKVSVTPETVVRGSTASVTVTAVDVDTGGAVTGAQVLLDGKVVGSTGTAFSFSPKAGQPNPAGLVKSPVQYFDAPFSITLTDPPPQTGKLHLNVGPGAPIPQKVALAGATWTVTPQWLTGQSFTANGASATIALPQPPTGSQAKVTVSLATTWAVAGEINGAVFPPQTFPGLMNPDPTVLSWTGSDLTAGWWALVSVSEDEDGNARLNVVATFQGVQ
ncbi:hypothetical protein ILFOPFJJ_04677 [Ensifer psoraleae]|uniref:hypothetical protein n=1 Tax=Sinorhizobium psoraleae TaxID=520838 RepID=UPI0015698240|nr:hypothetical protein [Sinorhizobium psoraleae]NRP73764.1 hypothetical protein [Sinorhizobium psoraleae]